MRLASLLREAAEVIGEAMDTLSALALRLPHEASNSVDNVSHYYLLELGMGVHAVADSLEETGASLSAGTAKGAAGAGER
jgi:hypothetical protein